MYSLAYHFFLLQRLILSMVMETKKTWGKHLQLIPLYQAFALPMHRDKQLSASRSSSTASGNADILHRQMKIYCDGRYSTTALKKAIGCDGQRMPLR